MKISGYEDNYYLFGMLFAIGNRLQVIGDTFFEEITAKQWFVLVCLEIYGNVHPSFNELSEMVGSSHQNVKQLVLKLVQKGYAEVYDDKTDKRKSRIKMSSKCEEFKEKYQIKQEEFIRALFEGVEPSELKYSIKVLLRMQENMERM